MIPDDLVRRLLAKHGHPSDNLQRGEWEGVANWVWLTDEVAVRVSKDPEYEEDARTEVVAVPAAVAAGVLTPRLLAHDFSRDLVDGLVTIYQRVEGVPLGTVHPSGQAFDALCDRLGEELAKLHTGVQECPDPNGWLDTGGPPDLEARLEKVVKGGWISDEQRGVAERWIDRLRDIPPETPTAFLHQDLHAMNILVHPLTHELTAILDWGDAAWGDPAQDLGMLPPKMIPKVTHAYRTRVPTDPWFEARVTRITLAYTLYRPIHDFPNFPRGMAMWGEVSEQLSGDSEQPEGEG
jgi:aminoglycoside phosphotransferase (APT) family kinase protein